MLFVPQRKIYAFKHMHVSLNKTLEIEQIVKLCFL